MSARPSSSSSSAPALRFGTDGWRGVIGDDFTFGHVEAVSHAAARAMLERRRKTRHPSKTVFVGFDGRFLAGAFARRAAEVLAVHGLKPVLSSGPVPTPACSLWVKRHRALGAVILTASHNPPRYGGFKIKLFPGAAAGKDFTDRVESLIRVPARFSPPERRVPAVDAMPDYMAALGKLVSLPLLRRAGLRVAADSMHGMGGTILEDLLSGRGSRVFTLRGEARADFGGGVPEPKEIHLHELRRTVLRRRCHLGVALDGDADRLALLDSRGRFVSPQDIMTLLADSLLRERGLPGHLARNFAGTDRLTRIAAAHGRRCLTFPVGFKHLSRAMLEDGVLFGGEEAGGIGAAMHMPERDGPAVALMVLEIMARRRAPLRDLLREVEHRYGGALHYRREDFALPPGSECAVRQALSGGAPRRLPGFSAPVKKAERLDGLKLRFEDGSWILFRPSGTEPLLRLYAESPSRRALALLLGAGRDWARALARRHLRISLPGGTS
jgi:phosphomannomutase